MKNFTVVICTYKRYYLIEDCLKNILNNSISPNKIIIIDQNYDYSTFNKAINIFKSNGFENYLIIRNLMQKGLTKSKNISLKYIDTKYVFFIDDDIILERKYFIKNLELIFKKKAHAVSGIISNYKNNPLKDLIYYIFNLNIFRDNRYYFINHLKLKKKSSYQTFQVPGGITCYDKKIFKKISFDDKYIIHNYEDVEFNIRLKKNFKKPRLFININSLAFDKLSKNTKENFNSRLYFMTLLYLKNKNYKNLTFFILSLIGFLISNIFSNKIRYFINIRSIIKKAVLKSNN
jgi:GT2 family glycosyltransferase